MVTAQEDHKLAGHCTRLGHQQVYQRDTLAQAAPAALSENTLMMMLGQALQRPCSTDPLVCGVTACQQAASTVHHAQVAACTLAPGKDGTEQVACDAKHAHPSSLPAAAQPLEQQSPYHMVDVRQATELSYEEFIMQYMQPNRPVLIRGVTHGWRAAREWVQPASHPPTAQGLQSAPHPQGDGRPSAAVRTACYACERQPLAVPHVEALVAAAGDALVCVTDTRTHDDGPATCHKMTLRHYAQWWRQHASPQASRQCSACGHVAECLNPHVVADTTSKCTLACANGPLHTDGRSASAVTASCMPEVTKAGLQLTSAGKGQLLYLKDFHFVGECPRYEAYHLPIFFSEDWLNAHYDSLSQQCDSKETGNMANAFNNLHISESEERLMRRHTAESTHDAEGTAGNTHEGPHPAAVCSDYRFLYLGPAGTWTPLHADVLRSFSWSANVVGLKRWLLLPPEHTYLVYDKYGRQLAPHFGHEHYLAADQALLPGMEVESMFPHLRRVGPLLYEVLQESGDALFVPSGWHHTVHNHADTLSINHNWLNVYNAHWTWALLQQGHADAAEAINDVRSLCSSTAEFEALVQRNLGANAGFSYSDWARLLCSAARTALARLHMLKGHKHQEQGSLPYSLHEAAEQNLGPPVRAAQLHCLLELQRAAWLLSELLEAQRDALALQAVTFAAYAGSLSASAMPEHDTTEAAAGLAAASALADAEGLLAVVKAVLEEHSVLHSRQPF